MISVKPLTALLTLSFVMLFAIADAQYGRHYHARDRHYGYIPRADIYIRSYDPGYRSPFYAYRSPYGYSHFGPSFGLRLNVLPFGYNSLFIGSVPYYYHQGIFYRPYSGGGYQVAAPPLGARVSSLPAGTVVQVIDGQKYYELGGTFYQEEIGADNHLSYLVAGTDGVLNTAAGSNQPEENPIIQKKVVTENKKQNEESTTGTKLKELPQGCKAVVINQQKFYQSSEGIYYQEVIDGDKVVYEVVGNTVKP